jgi:hypothetical protein
MHDQGRGLQRSGARPTVLAMLVGAGHPFWAHLICRIFWTMSTMDASSWAETLGCRTTLRPCYVTGNSVSLEIETDNGVISSSWEGEGRWFDSRQLPIHNRITPRNGRREPRVSHNRSGRTTRRRFTWPMKAPAALVNFIHRLGTSWSFAVSHFDAHEGMVIRHITTYPVSSS